MVGNIVKEQTAAVAAVWFVYSEQGKPLGRVYVGEDAGAPVVGARLADGDGWRDAVVAGVRELAPTCAMRRWRVVVGGRVAG